MPGAAERSLARATWIAAMVSDDPSCPLYSAASVARQAELDRFGPDRVTTIITGRELPSSLDRAIAGWKSRSGEQIRQEFAVTLRGQ